MQQEQERPLTPLERWKKWEPLYEAKTREEAAVAWQKIYDGSLTEEELEEMLDAWEAFD